MEQSFLCTSWKPLGHYMEGLLFHIPTPLHLIYITPMLCVASLRYPINFNITNPVHIPGDNLATSSPDPIAHKQSLLQGEPAQEPPPESRLKFFFIQDSNNTDCYSLLLCFPPWEHFPENPLSQKPFSQESVSGSASRTSNPWQLPDFSRLVLRQQPPSRACLFHGLYYNARCMVWHSLSCLSSLQDWSFWERKYCLAVFVSLKPCIVHGRY